MYFILFLLYENKAQTMMVNNFTNINKMHNYLSAQVIEPCRWKFQFLVWVGHENVVGYNWLMGSQPNMQINVGSRYTDYSIIDNW